jgi:hypothetical protein
MSEFGAGGRFGAGVTEYCTTTQPFMLNFGILLP